MTATDISIVSGPTSPGTASDWELFFARRALAMLKARLGREGLLDLLQPDLAAAAKTLTACAASSDGQWRPAITELHAEGLSAGEFLGYFHSIVDDSPQAATLMVAGDPSELDEIESQLRDFGIVELQRTGRIALPKLSLTG